MPHSNTIKSESSLKTEAIARRVHHSQHFHRWQHNLSYFGDKVLLSVCVQLVYCELWHYIKKHITIHPHFALNYIAINVGYTEEILLFNITISDSKLRALEWGNYSPCYIFLEDWFSFRLQHFSSFNFYLTETDFNEHMEWENNVSQTKTCLPVCLIHKNTFFTINLTVYGIYWRKIISISLSMISTFRFGVGR